MLNASAANAADWLVFRNGQTKTTEVWKGTRPVPGVNVPARSKVVEFLVQKGDADVNHYSLGQANKEDVVMHDPPVEPDPPSPKMNRPDLDGFISAIWADANLRTLRLQLISFKPLLREYLKQPNGDQVIQEAWTDLKSGIPGPAASAVESYAEGFHIPLVAPGE